MSVWPVATAPGSDLAHLAVCRSRSRFPFTIHHLPFTILAMLLNISQFLQLLTTGLFTGIFFGDRLGVTPIRPKLPASSFILFQQELHLTFGRLMPVLIIGSLLSGAVSLVLLRRDYKSSQFIFTAIATLCVLAVIVMTRLVNVPVNEALMTWRVAAPPQNLMELWAPWERVHTIRTVVSMIGFVCLAFVATTRHSNTTG